MSTVNRENRRAACQAARTAVLMKYVARTVHKFISRPKSTFKVINSFYREILDYQRQRGVDRGRGLDLPRNKFRAAAVPKLKTSKETTVTVPLSL